MAEATDTDFSDHVAINIRGTFHALREVAQAVAEKLALARHLVYAGMRGIASRSAERAATAGRFATQHDVTLRPLELDVLSGTGCRAAIDQVLSSRASSMWSSNNAGRLMSGVVEAFTAEQFLTIVIDTIIVVPGAFTQGSQHFAHAIAPAEPAIVAQYGNLASAVAEIPAPLESIDVAHQGHTADVGSVGDALVDVLGSPAARARGASSRCPAQGSRGFRRGKDRPQRSFVTALGVDHLVDLPAHP